MKSPHPHFDDRGAHEWFTELDPALRAAAERGATLLIELGREACSQCRALVQGVLPHERVAPVVRERFVLLAADADDTEPAVEELAMKLDDAFMLPFVIFADARGKFLGGLSGAVTPKRLLDALEEFAPDERGPA